MAIMSQYFSSKENDYAAPERRGNRGAIRIYIDSGGTIVLVKGNTKHLLGLTGQQLTGTSFYELIHGEDHVKTSASLKAVALGALSATLQCRFTGNNKNSGALTCSLSFDVLSKTTCCSFGAGALQTGSAEFQSICKAYKLAGVGWWEWDAATDQITVSDELFEIYNLDKALYTPYSTEQYLSLVHPADLPLVKAAMEQSRHETYNEYTHRLIQPSGNVIYVMHHVQTESDSQGNIVHMHGTVKDVTVQKESELALEESEQKWKSILDSIRDGFIATDAQDNVLYFNKAAEQFSNRNKADVVGKNLWELFPHVKGTLAYDSFQRAIEENDPLYFEYYSESLKEWFSVSTYPSNKGMSVFFRSITERKMQEEALKLTNERYKLISKASSDAIWDWDLLSDTIYWGEGIEAIFGHELMHGKDNPVSWANLIHPGDAKRVTTSIYKVIEGTENFWRDEYRYRKADNTYAIVSDRGYVIRDAGGKGIRMVGAMQDITAQKEAELALRLSEERFKLFFSSSPKPNWMFDAQTLRILEVNEAAIKLYGYTRKEFLQLSIADLKVKEDLPELDRFKQKQWDRYHAIVRHVKKSGEVFYIEIHSQAINLTGGRHYIVTGDDQTERLQMQQRLIKDQVSGQKKIAQAVINTQEQERSEIGRELHDNVNQLLTTTKLYIENIQYYPDQKDAFVQKGTALLQKSIDEIRFLSKQLVTPVMNDIGFEATIDEMIDHFRSLHTFSIDARYKLLEDRLEKELKLTVYRIIQEQLNNIVKHAKASMVHIAIIQSTRQLRVTVKDNGIGFSPDQATKGIGLKNIKNRVEIYNGNINIIAAPDAGCAIEAYFPI